MESAAEIRKHLRHPVVDADGHCVEFFPALADYLRDEGVDPASPTMKRLLPGAFGPYADWYALSPEERARRRVARPPWWGTPARNTRDLATAMFPSLFYERLDELGIDFSIVYPSVGLAFLHLDDEDERRGACRAVNRCNAEAFAALGDRLAPVAAIPMHTPEEAVRRARPTRSTSSGSGRCCSRATCNGRRRRSPRRTPTPRRGRCGSTCTGSTARTTTTPSGSGAATSASRPPSTRARSGGAAAARSRTTCTTTSATSPRASTRCARRCSWAASPAASRTSRSRSSRAAWPGRCRCTPTSSGTGRSATAPRWTTSIRPPSTAPSSPTCSHGTADPGWRRPRAAAR